MSKSKLGLIAGGTPCTAYRNLPPKGFTVRDCQLDAGALSPDTGPALSTSDAVELAGYLAELARAGLPLGDAMRAMVSEASEAGLVMKWKHPARSP